MKVERSAAGREEGGRPRRVVRGSYLGTPSLGTPAYPGAFAIGENPAAHTPPPGPALIAREGRGMVAP